MASLVWSLERGIDAGFGFHFIVNVAFTKEQSRVVSHQSYRIEA